MPSPRPIPQTLVIVPAFNESESVAEVVAQLREHACQFDVLVIDDGSLDATAQRAAGSASVVSLPFNLGIGGAMQAGYRYAALHGYDVAVQVDADGQHPARDVVRLVDHLLQSGADMVVGSRFLEPGTYRPSMPRMLAIRWLRTLIGTLCGLHMTDCTSGFRAVNRKVIRAFAHWYPDDYPEPEVVLLLHRAGYRVVELSTVMNQRTTGQTSIPGLQGLFYVTKVSAGLLLDTMRNPWSVEKVEDS